jgi:uncharacterized protein YndB with AHSA1/START domain
VASESILVSEVIPASPQRIFSAWMDSAEHSAFTGEEATVTPELGGRHQAMSGYVQGRTLELQEGSRIVQSWRTTEFPDGSPDSRVEITLEPTLGGTLVTLLHTDIPAGQSDRYKAGWSELYLSRLKVYFAGGAATAAPHLEPARRTDRKAASRRTAGPVRKVAQRVAKRVAPKAAARSAAGRASRAKTKTKGKPASLANATATAMARARARARAKTKPAKRNGTISAPAKTGRTKAELKARAAAKSKTKTKAKTKANAGPKPSRAPARGAGRATKKKGGPSARTRRR